MAASILPVPFDTLPAREQKTLLTFNCGIEREALRVTPNGKLAQTPHPAAFGSKLTHPTITTDFSEAQLELITPVFQSPEAVIENLDEIHRYICSGMNEEILWSASMPSILVKDAPIPLARFGTSNIGRLKTTYRSGLAYRYGASMQTICAVHYNFSFSHAFWQWLHEAEASTESLADFRSRRYFDLMRNFRRYSWLLLYLFGASPAVCNSFVRDKSHQFQAFDEDTSFLPFATSLRSGNLGYQSDTQTERLNICYNHLESYVASLAQAICTPFSPYEKIGISAEETHRQVNTSLLQSEAEFYSSIRAKCAVPPGENFLAQLLEDGVQYIEVRLLDVNPYLPLGIDEAEIRFLNTFLLFCLMTESPTHDRKLCAEVEENALAVVHEGRSAGLMLQDGGKQRSINDWAGELADALRPFARLMDQQMDSTDYSGSLRDQVERVADPDKTPSGRMLKDMASEQMSFIRFAMNKALAHRTHFLNRPLPEDVMRDYAEVTKKSLKQQQKLETTDSRSFDQYLADLATSYELLTT